MALDGDALLEGAVKGAELRGVWHAELVELLKCSPQDTVVDVGVSRLDILS
ncbi:MAG: hypothetical protein ABJX82_21570 [Paracoccaceae bacterium]